VTEGVPQKCGNNILEIIQEIKRNIVLWRYTRETNRNRLGQIHYGQCRILAHLLITLSNLRKYQGKNKYLLDTAMNIVKRKM
jgi:hypothetical protein